MPSSWSHSAEAESDAEVMDTKAAAAAKRVAVLYFIVNMSDGRSYEFVMDIMLWLQNKEKLYQNKRAERAILGWMKKPRDEEE